MNLQNSIEYYLEKGLIALSNAGPKGVFLGHYGASTIAGAFLLLDKSICNETKKGIEEQLLRNINRAKEFFERDQQNNQSTVTINQLMEVIEKNTQKLRNSGHGIIYGSLIIKTIHYSSKLSSFLDKNIITLLEMACEDRPNRYFAIKNIDSETIQNDKNLNSLIDLAFNSLDELFLTQVYQGQKYHFTGEKYHSITLSCALWDLKKLGYNDLVEKSLWLLANHIHFSSNTPSDIQPINDRYQFSPWEEDFWQRDWKDPHAIKFFYSASTLLKTTNQDKRKKIEDNLRKVYSTLT